MTPSEEKTAEEKVILSEEELIASLRFMCGATTFEAAHATENVIRRSHEFLRLTNQRLEAEVERMESAKRSFVNIYKDMEYDGRFIVSNEDWKSYADAYEMRDQLGNYLETVEIVRSLESRGEQKGEK